MYQYIKRIEDLVFGSILFLLFLPISLVVAVAIKFESPSGPIFADTPPRVGKNGRPFRLFKFRSMIPNAHILMRTDPKYKELFEQFKKNSFKLNHDPRVTKVGRFIRKYSLDEVPQFINIILGQMSLVGPRPYYEEELNEQQKKYPHTKELVKSALSVKPGLTGQWQVSGRSDVNFDKRIELDALYAQTIKENTLNALWYDFKILLKTPFVMLSGKGAV